jgi:hypothetical protein
MSAENDIQAAATAARNFESAVDGAANAANEYKQAQKAYSDAAKFAGKNLAALGGQLGRGTADLTAFNGMLEILSIGISKLGLGLQGAAGSFRANSASGKLAAAGLKIFGKATEEGAKLTLASAKFLTERLNASFKSFQELGNAGALGADGIEGLLQQSIDSKLGLEAWTKVVTANSQTLAAFSGSTLKGAERFTEIIGQLADPATDAGDQLRNLGLKGEDIAGWATSYIASEQRMGRARGQTDEQIRQGTVRYVKELDELARLTGISREELEKNRQSVELDQAYRANLRLMELNGQKDSAEATRKFILALGGTPQIQKGFMALASGLVNADEAAALMGTTASQAAGMMEDIKKGVPTDEVLRRLQQSMQQQERTNAQYIGATRNSGNELIDFTEQMKITQQNLSVGLDGVKTEQDGAANTANKLTKNTVDAVKNLQELNIAVTEITKTALPYAATAVDALGGVSVTTATAMLKIVKTIDNMFGGTSSGSTSQANPSSAPTINTTPPGPDGSGGAATGVIRPTGQLGTRGVSLRGGRRPSSGGGGRFGGGEEGRGESPIAFAGASGTPQAFAGLNSTLKEAVIAAAQMFHDSTGQQLLITSARRSTEDQQRLYDNYISGKSPYPAAKPGNSAHEKGNAVDIGNFNAAMEYLYAAGLKQTVPNDPVHFQYSAANGGVLSGPKSGYGAMLHGTEAVVPLPNGRSIPVETTNQNSQQMQMQIDTLEEIVGVLRSQLSVSEKLLAYNS